MNKKKLISLIFWIIVTLLPVLGIIIGLSNPENFSAAQNIWRERISYFGILAPIAFILIQALQVVITPINHYSIGVLGGFLYGPYFGALLNWIGRMTGHLIAFMIARYVGRDIAEKFVSRDTLEKYDKYVSDKSIILFLFYFLPIFPDDEMSYIAGLSKMKFRPFFIANVFGHIGGSLGLAYIGSGIDTKSSLFWVQAVVAIIALIILWKLINKQRNTPPL